MRKIENIFLKRSLVLLISIILIFLIIISTLFNIQILGYDGYQSKVIDQMMVETKVNPNRGVIYDRNGNVLASNKTSWILYAIPSKIDDKKIISKGLSEILSIDSETIFNKISNKSYKYQVISNSVDEENMKKIRAFIDENELTDQLQLTASSTRYYPNSSLASHTIGFVNSDGIGTYGLEKVYNNILEGTSGKYISSQDAQSNDMPFQYEIYLENENQGYNIVSTIDLYIQYQLESQLKLAATESGAQNRATGIVMNPQNGEVLAMAVYPYFDLNNPYKLDIQSQNKLDNKYLKDTKEYKNEYLNLLFSMWRNKAVSELYEPGSTFKLITTSVALQENKAKTTDMFSCTGALKVDGFYRPISCHKKTGHGSLNFKEALQQSCNPSMMNLAFRIGKDKFYEYFAKFGYTSKTGVDLPSESKGVYHSKNDFSNVSLAVYSFGQTFKTTAIQQLRAVSVIANGGYLVTPHLLKEVIDENGNVIYKNNTNKEKIMETEVCETISEILKEGVDGAGGAKNAYVAGYDIAAKTGTSEKKDKLDEEGKTSYRVSSCVGYAPSEKAKIAVIIIVDEPSVGSAYGSVVAAPYISNLMELILPYLGINPEYSEDDKEHKQVIVPDLEGKNIETATEILRNKGINYEIKGTGKVITKQLPQANYEIYEKSGKVILYTDTQEETYAKVPNVLNKSPEEATKILVDAGFNINIKGNKNYYNYGQRVKVTNQWPLNDSFILIGDIVTIEISFGEETD